MHSAIVVVDMPLDDVAGDTDKKRWEEFISDVDRKKATPPDPLNKYEGVKRLAENVWQVNFLLQPQILVRLVHVAGEHRFFCEILQFDAEPQWLPVGSNSKTS
jgi:hypothetical protein